MAEKVSTEKGEVDTEERSSSPKLNLNKRFAKSLFRQLGSHNKKKEEKEAKSLRTFVKEERKKQTKRNISVDNELKTTMYSDFVAPPTTTEKDQRKVKKKIISPFEQVQKLVTDAAIFDKAHDINDLASKRIVNKTLLEQRVVEKPMKRNRITLDKTLLKNHLRHTNVHNRLKEEEEMWGQHNIIKTKKIELFTSKNDQLKRRRGEISGGMYSDREATARKKTNSGPRTKTYRESEPPVSRRRTNREVKNKSSDVSNSEDNEYSDDEKTYLGKYTKQLLELKEQDDNKWGHGGFKELYSKENNHRKRNQSDVRRIVSDDEKIHRVVINEKASNNSIKSTRKISKKLSMSLHADMEEEEQRTKRSFKPHDQRKVQRWRAEEAFPQKNRVKSLAVKTPDSNETEVDGEWTERNVDFHSNNKLKKSNDVIEVSRVSLRESIHGEVTLKDKKRKILPKAKEISYPKAKEISYVISSEDEQPVRTIKSRRVVKSGKTSVRLVRQESESSFTDSSSDERYKNIEKTITKQVTRQQQPQKFRSTFSDYDSDFQLR